MKRKHQVQHWFQFDSIFHSRTNLFHITHSLSGILGCARANLMVLVESEDVLDRIVKRSSFNGKSELKNGIQMKLREYNGVEYIEAIDTNLGNSRYIISKQQFLY